MVDHIALWAARQILLQFFPAHDFREHQVEVRLVDYAQQQIVVRVHKGQGLSLIHISEPTRRS